MNELVSQPMTEDSQDLAGFGYKQMLDRTLGSFSSFAAGFSYISMLTGVFQMFYLGYGAGGPAFFWTWPVVFLGQLSVGLCFAELAAHYPLSGGYTSGRDGSVRVPWAGWPAGSTLQLAHLPGRGGPGAPGHLASNCAGVPAHRRCGGPV